MAGPETRTEEGEPSEHPVAAYEDMTEKPSAEIAGILPLSDRAKAQRAFRPLLRRLYESNAQTGGEGEERFARTLLLSRFVATHIEKGLYGQPEDGAVDPEVVAFMSFLDQELGLIRDA